MTLLSEKALYLWDWRLLTTAFVFLLSYKIARFYRKVSKYPKGPFPLPLLGNLLSLRNEKQLYKKGEEWARRYGDPFTLWMGEKPMLMLNSYEVIKDAFIDKRHDFSGRFPTKLGALQTQGNHDIVFEDYNSTWKALRKVVLSAVRFEKEGPELTRIRQINQAFAEVAPNGLPSDIVPWLGILYRGREKIMEGHFKEFFKLLNCLYKRALESYVPGSVRNFTHSMLSAREEALEQEKNDAQYLTEANMVQILLDIFAAATDTSIGELHWFCLTMTRRPDIQEKIQREIEDHLGQTLPTFEDRDKLPYTVACLYETLRFYPIVPLGIPHNTSCDTEAGGKFIPKNTGLLYNIYAVNHDAALWKDPEVFRPERFLDPATGKLNLEGLPALLTLGLGPRTCPGEKLGHADMFYVLVRLVQRVSFSAPAGTTTAHIKRLDSSVFLMPAFQDIVLTPRD